MPITPHTFDYKPTPLVMRAAARVEPVIDPLNPETHMKRIAILAAAAIVLGSALGGCIVVPEGGGYYHHHHGYYD